MVLDGHGRFTRSIRCSECRQTDRIALGCGVAPVFEGREYLPMELFEEQVWHGWVRGRLIRESRQRYPKATWGGLFSSMGRLWPWCPRWFLQESDPLDQLEAEQAMRRSRLLGIGAHIDPSALSSRDLSLLEYANQITLWCREEARKEEEKKRERQAENRRRLGRR